MNLLTKDRFFASGSVILALILGYISFGYPSQSAFFPRLLSVLLGLLGTIMLLRLSLKPKAGRSVSPTHPEREAGLYDEEINALKSAALVFGTIIAYSLVMTVVNYEAASLLFLGALMWGLGFKRPLTLLVLSLGLVLLLYGIFFQLLGVPRPESLWFQ